MFEWLGKDLGGGAIKAAPRKFVEGIIEVIQAPPQAIRKAWDNLSEEDQELFKEAALSAARLAAKVIIAADGKKEMKF